MHAIDEPGRKNGDRIGAGKTEAEKVRTNTSGLRYFTLTVGDNGSRAERPDAKLRNPIGDLS